MMVLVLASWLAYGVSQRDPILPGLALLFWGLKRRRPGLRPSGLRPPGLRPGPARGSRPWTPWDFYLWGGGLAFCAGYRALWLKPDASSTLAIAALQSAGVLGGLLTLLRPDWAQHRFLAAWLTLALAASTPFTPGFGAALGLFFLLALGGWLLPQWRASRSWPPLALGLLSLAGGATLALGVVALDRSVTRMLLESVQELGLSPPLGVALSLGGAGPNGQSMKPVLEAERRQEPSLHLRTKAFEIYQAGRWTQSPGAKRPIPASAEGAGGVRLLLFETQGKLVPAPSGVEAASMDARLSEAGVVESIDEPPSVAQLWVSGAPPAARALSAEERTRLTLVPESLRPALDRLLLEAVDAADSDELAARKLESFFRSRFQYSITAKFPPGDAALQTFLAQRKPAYCTYFASAMALALRQRGTPARLVGGFLAQQTEAGGRRFVVRARDAHAWVEARLGSPPRWIEFDPTPAASRMEAIGSADSTQMALDGFSRALRRWWSGYESPLPDWLHFAWSLPPLAGAWLLWRRRSRKRPPPAQPPAFEPRPAPPRLRQAYARFEAAVLQGQTRGASETDQELLDRILAEAPAPKLEAARGFLELYRRARFGETDIDASELERRLEALELPASVAEVDDARS